jgi:hypothetical protein
VNVTRIAGICSVLGCFLAMALQASGDGPQTNGSAGAAAGTNDPKIFSNVTKAAVSLDDLVLSNRLLNVTNDDKSAAAKDKKTKAVKSPKKPKTAKKSADKAKPDDTGWVSWIWRDNPTAPSVRSSDPNSWPKFK